MGEIYQIVATLRRCYAPYPEPIKLRYTCARTRHRQNEPACSDEERLSVGADTVALTPEPRIKYDK